MSVYHELRRRNVFRVAIAYLALAWLLIEVAGTLFPGFGIPDWAFRFVVVVLAFGFIPTLIFSWAYEITPEGVKREKDVVRDESITHITAKRLDWITIGLIVLVGAFVLADRFWLSPRLSETSPAPTEATTEQSETELVVSVETEKSIAVLPFVNMSADASNEYFSDGISEELLNLLAKIPELRVISRSSAFAFKGEKVNIPEAAEKLNVAHILEGSVRKAGNKVRITAQLIDARSDTHLWSETFDRTLDDIFAIQDEIAAAVVSALKVTLLDEAPKVTPTDPEAYSLYMQARYLNSQGSKEALAQSILLCEQALTIEPSFAAAWGELGRAYSNQAVDGVIPTNEGFDQAREAFKQALVVDSNHAPSYSRLGWISMREGNLSESAGLMQRALEADPRSNVALGNAATLLSTLGRHDEALAINRYSISVDPINPTLFSLLAESQYLNGQYDKATIASRTALRLSPQYSGESYKLGRALLLNGSYEAALAAFSEEVSEGFRFKGTALASSVLGQQANFEKAFSQLREEWGERWPSDVATIYAWIGAADLAFDWLETAVENRDSRLSFHVHDPLLSRIHGDPRWPPFLKSIGMAPEQLDAIEFNLKLPK